MNDENKIDETKIDETTETDELEVKVKQLKTNVSAGVAWSGNDGYSSLIHISRAAV
jgi:hypothetical protein